MSDRSDFITMLHGVQFFDPIDAYPGVCRRPLDHAGDCALSPLPGDLTLDEDIAWILGSFSHGADVRRVAEFARDCRNMIASLRALSFPLPEHFTIQVGDTHGWADFTLTGDTARLLHAALGAALGIPTPPTIGTR